MKKMLLALIALYVLSYAVFRTVNSEVWDEDGNVYVIYPADSIAIYYAFRPLSYLDGFFTEMRTHIGPHQ